MSTLDQYKDEVIRIMRDNGKLYAVRFLREKIGLDLRTLKDYCDKVGDEMSGIENEDYAYKLGYWNENGDAIESIAAFTVAELGVMLPNAFDTMRITDADNIKINGWKGYNSSDEPVFGHGTFFKTEAQARAAMLIYLLENNLTTKEEVTHYHKPPKLPTENFVKCSEKGCKDRR